MGGSVQKLEKDISENVIITLSQASNTPEISELVNKRILSKNNNITLVETDDPMLALLNSEVRCVLDFESGYAEKLQDGKTATITLEYDESKTKSRTAADIVAGAISEFEAEIVNERLLAKGIDLEVLHPFEIKHTNVVPNKGNNMMLEMMLPLLITMLVSVGGIPAATDLVAGEKEHNTFEPLLTTMPNRGSLLLGKYFAVTLFSFMSVIAILIGLVLGYLVNPDSIMIGIDSQVYGFSIDPLAALLALMITIALGMTFSGIQIALSTIAKSYKEAQTYLSFLMLSAMVPAYATMLIQASDMSPAMFAFPVLNTIAAFKMILGGNIIYSNLIIALVTSILFVVLTLWFAASIFKREKAIFRS
jgi:sodium transport system permease protein